MSLINKMLRDLDKRKASELTHQNLQSEIRPLPKMPSRRGKVWLAGGAGLVTLAAAGVWLAGRQEGDALPSWPTTPTAVSPITSMAPPPVASAVAPPPVPAPAPAAMPTPSPAVPEPTPQAPGPARQSDEAVARQKSPAVPEPPVAARPKAKAPAAAAAPAEAGKPAPELAAAAVEKTPAAPLPHERAEADFRRAQVLLALGRTADAAEILQAVLSQEPGYVAPRQALVKIWLEQKRLDDAMGLLREGLELLPAQIGWAMSLARLQVERGDFATAERTLSHSWKFASGVAGYAGFYGLVQHRLGHGKEALDLYQAAIRLAPGDGRWWLGLATVLEAGGRGNEAKEAYRRAFETGSLESDLAALAERKSR